MAEALIWVCVYKYFHSLNLLIPHCVLKGFKSLGYLEYMVYMSIIALIISLKCAIPSNFLRNHCLKKKKKTTLKIELTSNLTSQKCHIMSKIIK